MQREIGETAFHIPTFPSDPNDEYETAQAHMTNHQQADLGTGHFCVPKYSGDVKTKKQRFTLIYEKSK